MSALEKARQKWKLDQAKVAEQKTKAAEDKAKKARKPTKPRAGSAQKPDAKNAGKAEIITDMKAHLRTHTLPKESSIPLPKQIKDCLDALQKAQESLTAEQLEERTGHACGQGTALAEQLQHNPKVTITDGRFKYKAASDVTVHDRAGALKFIRQSHGCFLRDLTAAYGQAEKDLEKMKKEELIWVLPSSEKDQKMLFPRETPPLLSVSDDIRKEWLAVKVSEDIEEEAKELKKAGIASAVQRGKRERSKGPKKEKEKKKRAPNFSRYTKITNAHLPHLFVGEANSID